ARLVGAFDLLQEGVGAEAISPLQRGLEIGFQGLDPLLVACALRRHRELAIGDAGELPVERIGLRTRFGALALGVRGGVGPPFEGVSRRFAWLRQAALQKTLAGAISSGELGVEVVDLGPTRGPGPPARSHLFGPPL